MTATTNHQASAVAEDSRRRVNMSAPGTAPAKDTGGKPVRLQRLADVMHDCERRWRMQTVTEAIAGDVGMMVLAGDMLANGYGGPVDMGQAVRFWTDAKAADPEVVGPQMDQRLASKHTPPPRQRER